MSLLLVLCASVALAGANQGDVGGQQAAQIGQSLNNTNPGQTGGLPSEFVGYNGFGQQTFSGMPALPEGVNANNLMAPIEDGGITYIDNSGTGDLTGANWLNNEVPASAADMNPPAGTLNGTGGIVDYTQEQAQPSGTTGAASGATKTLNWYSENGAALLKQYPNLTIYDISTGVTWSAKYINGANHADIIPASASDASKIAANKITSNDTKTNWQRRSVIVTVNGEKYAGSMYAVGHGETNYCDYFKGVMCIHFTGSSTHGSDKVDSDHQAAIDAALKSGY